MLNDIIHEHMRDAYDEMAKVSTVPLWEIFSSIVATEPTPGGDPFLWRYADLRPLILDAGERISATEAERRVLILANPGLAGPEITQTLLAGLQLVMPGEIAPSHRHTQGAIRLVLESSGGYTAVDGERCMMRRGDFITTPGWCWHDHENTGDGPLIWLDGLDLPMVNFFGVKFAEDYGEKQQRIRRGDDDSADRWGAGMMPYASSQQKPYSPIYSYTYKRARTALMKVVATDKPDPYHGWKLIYTNPRNGGHVLATLAAYLQYLPAGFETRTWRSTESTVFAVIEGQGSFVAGKKTRSFSENDIFVVPNWTHYSLKAESDLVLFSFSDRAAQEKMGIWREDVNQISETDTLGRK